MASNVSVKTKKVNKKLENKSKLSDSSKAVKSTSRLWSYFSKRQPKATEKLDEQMRKNIHQPGHIPAYLKKRSQTFIKEKESNISTDKLLPIVVPEPKAEFKISNPHVSSPSTYTENIIQKSKQCGDGSSQAIQLFLNKYSIEHQKDLEKCAESRKELEEQVDELRHKFHNMKTPTHHSVDSQSANLMPFMNVFLQCISADGLGRPPKNDHNQQKLEEELQNLMSTIGHLDFKSAQYQNMIRVRKAQSERYRKQVENLEFYAQKYEKQNKFLKQKLENLK